MTEAACRYACGDVHTALTLYRAALKTIVTIPSEPRVAAVHSQLLAWCGELLSSHGDPEAGLEVLLRAMSMHVEAFGADTDNGVSTVGSGASGSRASGGDAAQARRVGCSRASSKSNIGDSGVRLRAFILRHLGNAHALLRNPAESERCLHASLELLTTRLGATIASRWVTPPNPQPPTHTHTHTHTHTLPAALSNQTFSNHVISSQCHRTLTIVYLSALVHSTHRHLDACAAHLCVAECALLVDALDRAAAGLASASDVLDAFAAQQRIDYVRGGNADVNGSEGDRRDGNTSIGAAFAPPPHPLHVRLHELRASHALASSSGRAGAVEAQTHLSAAFQAAAVVYPQESNCLEHSVVTHLKAIAAHIRRCNGTAGSGSGGDSAADGNGAGEIRQRDLESRYGTSAMLQPTGLSADYFCGRRAEMELLEAALLEQSSAAVESASSLSGAHYAQPNVVLLTGPTGVGKTELLLAFTHKHRHEFTGGVHWIRGPEAWRIHASVFDVCSDVSGADQTTSSVPTASVCAAFASAVTVLEKRCADYIVCFDGIDTPDAAATVNRMISAVTLHPQVHPVSTRDDVPDPSVPRPKGDAPGASPSSLAMLRGRAVILSALSDMAGAKANTSAHCKVGDNTGAAGLDACGADVDGRSSSRHDYVGFEASSSVDSVADWSAVTARIALVPMRRYDRELLLFRTSRGMLKDYENKVKSTFPLSALLVSDSTCVLHSNARNEIKLTFVLVRISCSA
jgi:hypothetical protein